jgi:hypothetical protein
VSVILFLDSKPGARSADATIMHQVYLLGPGFRHGRSHAAELRPWMRKGRFSICKHLQLFSAGRIYYGTRVPYFFLVRFIDTNCAGLVTL